jgi:mono/diheme cytochrome c family protein
MNRPVVAAGAVALLLALLTGAGCGGSGSSSNSSTDASGASSGGTGTVAAVSKYDSGPRAGESPVDEELAEQGEQLFSQKGCSACHGFGRKLSGPDLQGVSMRRTAQWMEEQILHPDVMTKEDPIARKLFAENALQMPNQGLKPDEARAVIEYLKHKDHEAGVTAPAAGK